MSDRDGTASPRSLLTPVEGGAPDTSAPRAGNFQSASASVKTPEDLSIATTSYRRALLPKVPNLQQLRSILPDYEAIAHANIALVAARSERDPGCPFIDTKLDLITGRDFPDDDPVRGRSAVYGWIQGRGLEAAVGHAEWLRATRRDDALCARLERIIPRLLDAIRTIRARNRGHVPFFVRPDGTPFSLGPDGRPSDIEIPEGHPFGFGDTFCAKGMLAAAGHLGDTAARSEALDYLAGIEAAIWAGAFRSDQISLDPKNPVALVPGKVPQGPFMIHLGALALLVERGEADAVDRGLRILQHLLSKFANLRDRLPELEPFDFWEANDREGRPWREEGAIRSRPSLLPASPRRPRT